MSDTNKQQAMSDETSLILKVLDEQNEARKIEMLSVQEKLTSEFKAVSIRLESLEGSMNKYADAKVIQNGRLDKVEKRTKFIGWVSKNPVKSLTVSIFFIGIIVALYENFSFEDIVKLIKLIT